MKSCRRIILTPSVLNIIREETGLAGEMETGGALVGRLLAGGVLHLVGASGPGPKGRCASTSVLIDGRYTTEFCNQIYWQTAGSVDYVGDWHSHPRGSVEPSRTDLKAMRLILASDICTCPQPISLIYRPYPEEVAVYVLNGWSLRKTPWAIGDGLKLGSNGG